jgi:hypothetical protein
MDLVMATATRKNAPPQKPTAPITAADPTIGGQLLRTYVKRAQTAPRNCTGFDLACQLRDNGIDKEQAEALMREYAEQVPQEDRSGAYTVQEALASLGQAFHHEAREPLEGGSESRNERRPQSAILIDLASSAEYWVDESNGKTFATFPVGSHKENWPIKSTHFRRWLANQFFEEEKKMPSSGILQDIMPHFELLGETNKRQTFVRVGAANGKIYVDLGNETWQVVEISASGWRVIDDPPVKFTRSKNMEPLPEPLQGGDLNELKSLVNVTDEDWMLLASWIVETFNPSKKGAYPVLFLQGEQGSAKSTTASIITQLIDPNTASPRSMPNTEKDMMIAVMNQLIISYDNVSTVSPQLSDDFSRLSTGNSLGGRALYTDDEEATFTGKRPLILNGIYSALDRNDLIDRCIFLNLPHITDEKRSTADEIDNRFHEAQPRILGALLSIVSEGLRNIDTTVLRTKTRMADFETWIAACSPALPFSAMEFQKQYHKNRANAFVDAIESDPVAVAVERLMEEQNTWEGTATELLEELENKIDDKVKKSKTWPTKVQTLTTRIRRAAPALRVVGVEIVFTRNRERRVIEIEKKKTPINDDTVLNPEEIRAAIEEIAQEREKGQGPPQGKKPTTVEEDTEEGVEFLPEDVPFN